MHIRALVLLVCAPFLLAAQEHRATLTGRVVDAQGAVIPAAKITATNEATGATSTTISGPDGGYPIPFPAPGQYTVTAEQPGFKRYARENLQPRTGERVGVDIDMEVGQTSDSVKVTAEAPLLNTARMLFAGNIMPSNRLSPIAKSAPQFYPLPNQPGEADSRNNYLANTVRTDTDNNELGRLDFNISSKNKFKANSPKLVLPRFDFDVVDDMGSDAGNLTPFDIFQAFGDVVKVAGNVRFNGPNLSPTSSSFGRITGQNNLPHNVQLGERLVW